MSVTANKSRNDRNSPRANHTARTLCPNSFLIDVRISDQAEPLDFASKKLAEKHIDVFIEADNSRYLKLLSADRGFGIYYGDQLHIDRNYINDPGNPEWNPATRNGCFINYNQATSLLIVHSDYFGTEIAYYRRLAGRVVISNRIENLQLNFKFDPDWLGVYQFLKDAYTVGERTLVTGIFKTRPLSKVVIDVVAGTVKTSVAAAWTTDQSAPPKSSDIADLWQHVLVKQPRSVLMLSGGWDSRLLMAANTERFDGSYTHGDLESRELKLAYAIGAPRLPEMYFRGLQQSDYQAGAVAERCDALGHAFFPHWYSAAKWLSGSFNSPLTSGLSVEHVSGHYGINSIGKGRVRLANTLKSMFFASSLDGLSQAAARKLAVGLLSSPAHAAWCLPDQLQDVLRESHEENASNVNAVLASYQAEGTLGVHEITERFRLEHSGRQYFALQTKCGIPFNGYSHPYADSCLAREVLSIPYSQRINYKLSRNILKLLDPQLLELPMAATLLSAKYPIVLQEASRGARIVGGRAAALVGRQGAKLGWNDFQFIYGVGVFDEYIEGLKGDYWPKQRMRAFVQEKARIGSSAYPILDMFGKIQTIDHVLTGSPRYGRV